MPNSDLQALTDRLVRRKRFVTALQRSLDGLLISAAVSLLVAVVSLFLRVDVFPVVAVVLGAGAALGYAWGAGRPIDPYRALLDADRAYRSHEQLATAYELARVDGSSSFSRALFRRIDAVIRTVEPRRLYRPTAHRRYLLLPALLLATAAVVGMELPTSAADRSIVQLGGEEPPETTGPAVEQPPEAPDGGTRRVEELEALGPEAGETDADAEPPSQETESVEEQVRQLERESFEDDESGLGENAEEAVRGALRRGLSESEILDLITRMQQQGESTADIVEELEEGSGQQMPDANTGNEATEDAVDRLSELLTPVPPSEDESAEDASEGQSDVSDPSQGGETEVTPGSDAETGEAQGSADGRQPGEPGTPPETEGEQQARGESPSDRGGTAPARDSRGDDFSPTNESRVAAEITGTVIEETFLNLVIRDLPQEAVSELEDTAPDVRYRRAVEQAIAREDIPADLEPLVRSYFLRIARQKENEND